MIGFDFDVTNNNKNVNETDEAVLVPINSRAVTSSPYPPWTNLRTLYRKISLTQQ